MKFINLTPHTINEVTTGNSYEPSGKVARAKSTTILVNRHDDVPIYQSTFGTLEGLPDPVENTLYIVSALALNSTTRTDVVSPGTLQRDENGQPIGCVGFRVA